MGWSVVERASASLRLIDCGVVRTEQNQPMTKRLSHIFSDLNELIGAYRPDAVSVETLFFVKNAKTLAQVGHTRGIVLLVAGQKDLPVFEYAPRQIKMALTGYGGADKKQMQTMVQRLLRLADYPRPDDAADAVAVALCHAQYAQTLGKSALTV